jgi:type I restriction enzyme S subunit
MRVGTAKATDLLASVRLDSKYFLDEAQAVSRRLKSGNWKLVTVRETFGADKIWAPNRFERVPAASVEHGKPILVPYDCFRYMPHSDDFLSKKQVGVYDKLELQRGTLLIVCSGRNLGPATLVDSYLERFVLSHDMIRISPGLSDDLFYLTALLHTKIGQMLIRLDRNGSVVDHLSHGQVAAMHFPVAEKPIKVKCAKAFKRAFELREGARLELDNLAGEYLNHVGLSAAKMNLTEAEKSRRFVTRRSEIVNRFDSEPFAPLYSAYRSRIRGAVDPTAITDLATIVHLGRKATSHVADEQYGVKILSGRQVAQYKAIGLKIVSHKAWKDLSDYLVATDTVVMTCDGRAEENLADCALVREDRAGWAATEHIIRLVPKKGVNPGLLYLACSSKPIQQLLKSMACGSVVDGIRIPQVSSVEVPYPRDVIGRTLGDRATVAWDQFAEAARLEDMAAAELEAALA